MNQGNRTYVVMFLIKVVVAGFIGKGVTYFLPVKFEDYAYVIMLLVTFACVIAMQFIAIKFKKNKR